MARLREIALAPSRMQVNQGEYTQYKLYRTGYMGHKMGLVEIPDDVGDKTS